jgi:hypothetical protein
MCICVCICVIGIWFTRTHTFTDHTHTLASHTYSHTHTCFTHTHLLQTHSHTHTLAPHTYSHTHTLTLDSTPMVRPVAYSFIHTPTHTHSLTSLPATCTHIAITTPKHTHSLTFPLDPTPMVRPVTYSLIRSSSPSLYSRRHSLPSSRARAWWGATGETKYEERDIGVAARVCYVCVCVCLRGFRSHKYALVNIKFRPQSITSSPPSCYYRFVYRSRGAAGCVRVSGYQIVWLATTSGWAHLPKNCKWTPSRGISRSENLPCC